MPLSSEIQFQFYPATIKDASPMGLVCLDQFFESIRNPKPEIKQVFEQIKHAEQLGDMETKAKLKTKLFSFTPAVIVKQRRAYSDILSFTGLMPLDFDHLTPQTAQELKEHLFYDFPYIIGAWLSPSKCGVRAFVNIPICHSTDEYKLYFEGLAYHSDLGKYTNFDHAPKNAVLPLFLSYDPDIYYGECSVLWDTKYTPPKPPPLVQYKYDANPSRVVQITKSAIDKISTNGHPQLRGAAFALGGYVGAGYIGQTEATELIDNLIDTNNYLSQKSSVYKVTARTMIQKGINQPLYL